MNWARRIVMILVVILGMTAASAERPQATLIKGARVFDGTGAPAVIEDVLIVDDRIAAVGRHLKRPRATRVIDARGMTLIPGLHDLHTHLRAPAIDAPEDLGKSYAAYLLDGVTTVNDYSLSGEMIAPIRDLTRPEGVAAPHLEMAVRIGVPGGHGTEFGWGDFFTLQVSTPRSAHLAMKTALRYKPDVIKVFADGWRYGRDPDLNSINEDTLAAIVADAHAAGIPVVTHTVTLEGAKIAAMAGVDSVGHGVGDAPVDDELIALMRKNHTAYIATMATFEPQEDRTFLPAEWASLTPGERAREEARMAKPLEPIQPYDAKRWAIMQGNIRALKAAGIRIGIGTDAGIEGTYHGESTLREIWRLTQLGFTPAEALVAATSTSAEIMGLDKIEGAIRPGMRADLVLIAGKPDRNIADLYNVRHVWVSGRDQDLIALRKLADGTAPTPMPVTVMPGPIDTGARDDGRTDVDTLPVESTEPGTDHSRLTIARPNDPRVGKKLFLAVRLGARAQPFAQMIVPLTRGGVTLADASGFIGVAFDARGSGRYSLAFDSYGLEPDDWFHAGFDAEEGVHEVRVPFSALSGNGTFDLKSLRALLVRLHGDPGATTWLEIGNLRFYR
ncbi:amidohydrolase family protein [Sphingomonas sp.]|jgi:imidazolonepropionase-like amidohydrolase|uniref:amidohydrolase family protein n=1 Tax=Sphingomonas sp. TaxID=28214 RepID=UPI002E3282FF|nr:amidohydrolase family protein [Sphingomonas sp.]HEX4694564.1 amidohydrolase family protein [Sphingomonas sp.]